MTPYADHRRDLAYYRQWRKAHPEKVREYHKAEYERLRRNMRRLFGSKCAYCGCDDPRILELNHVNGKGAEDRRKRSMHHIIRDILNGKRNRNDFELTCSLCNILHYIRRRFPELANQFKVTWA